MTGSCWLSMTPQTDRLTRIDALNRLLRLLYRSLPVYLEGVRPWAAPERRALADALAGIARDHQHYARRVAEAIIEQDGLLETGQFAIEFAGIHDCSAEYLARRTLELLQRDLGAIGQAAQVVADHAKLRELVEEIEGNARGHLDNLRQLLGE